LSRLSHTTATTAANPNDTCSNESMTREFERALATLKQKRAECLAYTAEIDQLKRDLSAASIQLGQRQANSGDDLLKAELTRLTGLVDELQREKVELANDLIDKNTRLDAMLEQEEQFQSVKSQLEMEVYAKQEHINECERLIGELRTKSAEAVAAVGQSQAVAQRIKELEAQVGELQLKVTNREHEVQKTREMYIEVCREKNDLEESVKMRLEEEMAGRVRAKVEVEVGGRLAEWKEERERLVGERERQVREVGERLAEMSKRCAALERTLKEVGPNLFEIF